MNLCIKLDANVACYVTFVVVVDPFDARFFHQSTR